ncbi:MAG: SpoIIE family protein phosphatase [Bryobacterales bacterium]|nr:SpoIIE family protein phosphatase [Bryobacterales bacterium]
MILQVRSVSGELRQVVLDKTVRLGRDSSCELFCPEDIGLSRQHLAIEGSGETWSIRDLGSKNGTYVNGERIAGSRRLKTGDSIHASRTQIVVGTEEKPKDHVLFDPSPSTNVGGTVVVQLKDLLDGPDSASEALPKESRQWETPAQALLRAGRELVGGRPLEDLFPVILDLALEAVNAERGALFTTEGDNVVLQASRGGQFRISTAVREQVLKEKASLLIQNAFEDQLLQHRESIILQGIRSLMAVPLQTEDRVIGFIYVDGNTFRRRFSPSDLNLLTVMANVAAMRIEHARLAQVEQAEQRMRLEVDQAAEIQRSHLPSEAPAVPGYLIAGAAHACHTVGGDYFDYLPLADGRTALVVADVAGKGLPAALMMMNLQARAHAIAETCKDLAEFATRLNRSLIPHCPRNKFITLFVCAAGANGEIAYCNAGHNPPLLIRGTGEIVQLKDGGAVLGLLPQVRYGEGKVQMRTGDLLVLYTDGITEAENPAEEEFDTERLAAAVGANRAAEPAELVETALQAVRDWTEGAPASDDRTLLIVRRL